MTTLLDLPPEIIMKILGNLSYENVEKCRPTCLKFDEVGRHIMRMGMRKLAIRSQKLLKAFIKKDHTSKKKKTMNMKRLNLGVRSLLSLEAIIRLADASSFHLVGSGVLPPFSGAMLDYINRAVTMITWRNPLIGEERLRNIYSGLVEIWTDGFRDYSKREPHTALPDKPLFLTLVDIFNTLPLTREHSRQTDYGVQIFYHLPEMFLVFDPDEYCCQETHDSIKMLMRLLFIITKANQFYIEKTWQIGNYPNETNRSNITHVDGLLVFQIAYREEKASNNLHDLNLDNDNILGFRVLMSTTDETGNSGFHVLSSSRFPHIC
uniref:F-box domain-containing protein n=1 Tax=Cuerna arida TaxID=1464854 RepID=A0A1B6G1P7_9HEMI